MMLRFYRIVFGLGPTLFSTIPDKREVGNRNKITMLKSSFQGALRVLIILAPFAASGQNPEIPANRDQRIESLIKKMTLEEKVGQLNFIVGETIVTGPTMHTSESVRFDDQIRKGTITGLFNVHGAAYTGRLQKIAVEESRLGIPLLFGADVIHGFKTVTPIPLAEAASWDLAAIEASARMAANEASSAGISLTFAPMVDISRDPRWGRIAEGAGEDPFLGSQVAIARVRGFQGQSLSSPNSIAACVKHFAAYGAAEAGRDYNTVDISKRVLYETYLPPFKAAIDAGAASLMPSFNELDGAPATANKNLIRDILQKEWKYNGLIISDYGAVGETVNHGYAADGKHAAELCLEAGTDLDMMSYLYLTQLPGLVKDGRVEMKVIDDAVRRVLRLKFDLGLFDNPYLYADVEREKKTIRSKENLQIALDMARKSIVLLKNENSVLPLQRSTKHVAVIGPLADNKEDMNGTWSFFGESGDPVTILEGIKTKLGDGATVVHERGCGLYDNDQKNFPAAVEAASKADVVIIVVGESAVMNGEGASRADISLPGAQEELIKAIAKTGKPIVVTLVNGRPLTLEWLDQNIPAIVETWTLGSQAGHAVADVLFGDFNPSGKLPVSFPRHIGQIPLYYNHKNTGRPYHGKYDESPNSRQYVSKYRDIKNTPLYPFGFGLSYSTFEYSDIRISSTSLPKGKSIEVTVDVKNTSTVDGAEVVQLYIRDKVASVTRPVKELKGFKKILVKAGQITSVTFTISEKDLAFYRADMTFGTEPGSFDVYIGGDSERTKTTSFELTN
jgi:beta-glucosidase